MILEALLVALRTMRANKRRTLLTVLGNIIAVAALVLIVAFVQGLNAEVSGIILRRGADTLFVQRFGPVAADEEWERVQDRPPVTVEDADAIRLRSTLVAHVLSEWNFADTVRSTRHAAQNVRIEGRSWEYPHFLDEPLERGRDFTRAEDRRRASVAILGSEIAEALFPGESALGRSVRIADRPFDVIGVMRPRGALLGQSQDKYVIVPIGAAIKTWGRPQGEIGIAVKPTSPADLEACADEVHTILRAHRGLRPSQEDPFELLTAAAYLKMYRRSTRAIYGALIGLVALALVVGGIVIANVMLMVVTQRTREIGIRKAVGARRGHILTQFLVESATLSLAGGLAGFALGAAVTALVDAVTPLTFRIQPWSVALGFGLVLLVGALAGLYPAARAAALDPIAALRQER